MGLCRGHVGVMWVVWFIGSVRDRYVGCEHLTQVWKMPSFSPSTLLFTPCKLMEE